MNQLCKIAFLYVNQLLYLLERPDRKGRQHFNLIQLPIEIGVDLDTWFSFHYNIAVYFKRPTTDDTHNEILTIATTRSPYMSIKMRIQIAESIIFTFHTKRKKKQQNQVFWTWTIKIHLKHLKVDDISMLKGLRPFILTLDKIQTLRRICKCYNSKAINTLLSIENR